MQCTSPIRIRNGTFPCGKCLSCRIAKSREWSARLVHELGAWSDALFVTLTYDDEHLPENRSLVKSDLQKFFKRLRKNYKKPLRYFACGEYGDTTMRPHYHAIIYGIGYKDRQVIKDSWHFCQWQNFNDKKAFGTVTYDSCRYVSDYIFKKYSKELAEEVYTSKGLEVPFKICSQKLGLSFVYRSLKIFVQISDSVYTVLLWLFRVIMLRNLVLNLKTRMSLGLSSGSTTLNPTE